MTDNRELLELAAKAAGIEHEGVDEYGCRIGVWGDGWSGGYTYWNPRESDGDALRLAVRLRLDVMFGHADVEVTASQMPDGDNVCPWSFCAFAPDKDDYAATRLAIVRAAAEIGRQMENL